MSEKLIANFRNRLLNLLAKSRLQILFAGITLFLTGISYAQKSSVGVNLTGDWLWADVIRGARTHWDTAAHPGDAAATEDSQNWPTQDCSLTVWEGHSHNQGTYALSFNGKATIQISYGYGTVNGLASSSGSYNATTNTTTATILISNTGFQNCGLSFTNTQRTATSATNTGITNVHLYRPVSEGASTSYSPETVFTNQTLALTSNFSVIRFMDLLSTNGNLTETNWSDRVLPSAWNQKKIAYEYIVAYGNASNTDIYINIPLHATPDYYTNLANLIKYGSNGVTPYTSVQVQPIYSPLNPNLHVYLEYCNEVWNWGFSQSTDMMNTVYADQVANNAEWAILNYDGAAAVSGSTVKPATGGWRRVAYQAKLISDSFRAVYGDAAMPPNANATVRPLIEFQVNNGQGTAATELGFINNYFNNADGISHVASPHPVNYFFWGGGGATYYNSNLDTAATVDDLFASGIPNTNYAAWIQVDSAWTKAYGLKRVAYEGGWGVYSGSNSYSSTPGSAAALAKSDPRATTAQMTAHAIFQQSGGDLNIFYTSSSWIPNYRWSLTDLISNLTTPLFQSVTQINSNQAPPVTYGSPISDTGTTTFPLGSQFSPVTTTNRRIMNNGAFIFVPLIATTGNYQINLMVSSTSSGKSLLVQLDGQNIGLFSVPQSKSMTASNVVIGTFYLTAGQHGLIFNGQSSSDPTPCIFENISFTPVPPPEITGQPTNQVALQEGSSSFNVTATGPNLTYQWLLNGVPLVGQTNSNLSLSNLTRGQAGKYNLQVTNLSGTVCSSTATLIVQTNYTQWASQYLNTIQLSSQLSGGLSATPKNDGIPNLFKYLFDINPASLMSMSDKAALPLVNKITQSGSTYLTLTFRKNPNITGITLNLQTSNDLTNWQTVTPDLLQVVGTDFTTGDPIEEIGVIATGARKFIRMMLTSP